MPPLLNLDDESAYRTHFQSNYCKTPLITHDGIPIYFPKHRFTHAFFESVQGHKDVFSQNRAQRMDWIRATLTSSTATLYQGWMNDIQQHSPSSRIAFEFEKFVVVVRLYLDKNNVLKGNFITCYHANNSIDKIKESPLWDKELCLESLSRL